MSLKSAYVASLASYIKPELPVPAKRACSETPPPITEDKDQSASSSRPQPLKKTRTQVSFILWFIFFELTYSFQDLFDDLQLEPAKSGSKGSSKGNKKPSAKGGAKGKGKPKAAAPSHSPSPRCSQYPVSLLVHVPFYLLILNF
jgi:hypothetical protein